MVRRGRRFESVRGLCKGCACLDAENAVWYGDVPNKRCVRIAEGGEVLQTIELDGGCLACALGGEDRRTLFMMATEWNGPANMFAEPRTG